MPATRALITHWANRSLLRRLDRGMAAAGLATDDDFGTRVRRDAAEIARRHAAPDAPGRFIVAGCALVLASFQEMVAGGVSREDAYEVVRRAVLARLPGTYDLGWTWLSAGLLVLSRSGPSVGSAHAASDPMGSTGVRTGDDVRLVCR